jgi:signal recognition particle receptor subunit beta
MFVVDSSEYKLLEEAKLELVAFLSQQSTSSANLLVFANKSDKKMCCSKSQIISKLELHSLKQKWHVEPCCALNGQGISRGFEYLFENNSRTGSIRQWCTVI